MGKVKVLIIEDDQEQAVDVADSLSNNGYLVTGVAKDLNESYGLFYSQSPDIVIVDIYLNGQPGGITFVETMNKNSDTRKPFIFLTSHSDIHTFSQARSTKPYSYLLKPFNPMELQYAIELALENFVVENGYQPMSAKEGVFINKDLFVKMNRSLLKISMMDILYIEVSGKFSNLVTVEGSFLTQHALKYLLNLLDQQVFYRVHRNFIVNKSCIRKIELAEHEIVLSNDKIIPFSKNFLSQNMGNLEILK